jgi:hypothetical protein
MNSIIQCPRLLLELQGREQKYLVKILEKMKKNKTINCSIRSLSKCKSRRSLNNLTRFERNAILFGIDVDDVEEMSRRGDKADDVELLAKTYEACEEESKTLLDFSHYQLGDM